MQNDILWEWFIAVHVPITSVHPTSRVQDDVWMVLDGEMTQHRRALRAAQEDRVNEMQMFSSMWHRVASCVASLMCSLHLASSDLL